MISGDLKLLCVPPLLIREGLEVLDVVFRMDVEVYREDLLDETVDVEVLQDLAEDVSILVMNNYRR